MNSPIGEAHSPPACYLMGMPKRSSKNTLSAVRLQPTGGLNRSVHPSAIGVNELTRARNVVYDPVTGSLTTRGGLECVSTAALDGPVECIQPFIRSDSESYLMGVSDGTLYHFDFDTTSWAQVAPLSGAAAVPGLRTFNTELIIADGGTGLSKWDGSTVSAIADSPRGTFLAEIGNRLVSNDVEDRDAVLFSGVEDATDWDSGTGGAVKIRAGYGDGYEVNGFAVLHSALIVSKVAKDQDGNVVGKKIYKVETSGGSITQAYPVSQENAAVGPRAIGTIGQDVLFIDQGGVKRLGPTQAYGDIETDVALGRKIEVDIRGLQLTPETCVQKLSSQAALWLFLRHDDRDTVYALSSLGHGFTELAFHTPIYAAVEYGGWVYLAGESGHLYRLINQGVDEISPGVSEPFVGVARFKALTSGGQMLLKRTELVISGLDNGRYAVEAYGESGSKVTLGGGPVYSGSSAKELYDATEDLADADYPLFDGGEVGRTVLYGRFRDSSIMLQVRTFDGARISLVEVSPFIASVGG